MQIIETAMTNFMGWSWQKRQISQHDTD